MRILSSFKDYYDHVGARFGYDPDVRYVRGTVTAERVPAAGMHRMLLGHEHDLNFVRPGSLTLGLSYVVAGGRMFPVVRRSVDGKYDERTAEYTPSRDVVVQAAMFADEHWPRSRPKSYEHACRSLFMSRNCGLSDEQVLELTRRVGEPVFEIFDSGWFDGMWKFCIGSRVPVLKDLGIPALVPAEEMWKAIYQTITSVIRGNPDKAPPVEVGNADKIRKAGFDVVSSFRGRAPKARKAGRR